MSTFGSGASMGPWAPLRSDEVQVVEIAVVIQLPGPERRETCPHRQHVVAQPRTRTLEGHAVAPHHMRAHLRAETEPELPAGRLLQLPRRRRRDERTARKRHRDARRQFQTRRGLRCHGGVEIGGPTGFGEQQPGEPRGLRTPGQVADLVQRLRNRHHVDLHAGTVRRTRVSDADSAGTARGGTPGQPEGRVKVEIKKLAGAVAATTVMFSVGAVAPASAADGQVFGLQQTVSDPNGGEIAYTVTKFLPSADAIPYPVSGQLYEATVRADAINGLATPVIPAFSAQAESGQNYPALANVWTPQGLSGMTLLPGGIRPARSTSMPWATRRPASFTTAPGRWWPGSNRSASARGSAPPEEEAASDEGAPVAKSLPGSRRKVLTAPQTPLPMRRSGPGGRVDSRRVLSQPRSRCANPDARTARRSTAARSAASEPTTRTLFFARVIAG